MQNEKVCWTYVLSNLNLGTRLYLPEESILQNEKGCWTCILSDLNLRIRLLCLYQFQFEMGKHQISISENYSFCSSLIRFVSIGYGPYLKFCKIAFSGHGAIYLLNWLIDKL